MKALIQREILQLLSSSKSLQDNSTAQVSEIPPGSVDFPQNLWMGWFEYLMLTVTNLVPLRHRDVEDVTTTYYDDAEFHENEEEPAVIV